MEDSVQPAQVDCVHMCSSLRCLSCNILCVFACACILRAIKRTLLSQSMGREERRTALATVSSMLTSKARELPLFHRVIWAVRNICVTDAE